MASSVLCIGVGAQTFFARKNMYKKINKMPEFWVNLARKIIKIPEFFVIISQKIIQIAYLSLVSWSLLCVGVHCTKSMYNTTPSQLS